METGYGFLNGFEIAPCRIGRFLRGTTSLYSGSAGNCTETSRSVQGLPVPARSELARFKIRRPLHCSLESAENKPYILRGDFEE